MAPRREDSQSVLSYRSNGSGGIQQLSISDDEISLLSGQSVGLYIEEDALDPTSDAKATDAPTTTTTTSLVDEQRQTRNHEGDDHWEGALTQMLIPNHLPSTEEKNIVVAAAITRDDAAASSSSELSLGHKSNSSFSTSSIMTNSSCFDGLIVGFRDRRASASATDHAADDDASEDDLIVGFVDRHAIANRDSRVK